MAQPAGFLAQDNRTDLGIPVFWTTANSDPPWNFKVWFDQFLMAVTVKENVNPEVMLEDPKPVLEEPLFNRSQEMGESLESFHAALTA